MRFKVRLIVFLSGFVGLCNFPSSAQFIAGGSDTINPGVPVTLSANFGQLANEVYISDNKALPNFNIGFTFNFYGEPYTKFSIGENGWISFDNQNAPYWGATRNIRLPSIGPTSPKACILGAMEDYNPDGNASPYIFYQTVGQAPHRKLVVMWCQIPMFNCPSALATFQIVLIEGDTIEIHISRKPICDQWDNECTIGIQDEFGIRCDTLPNMNRNSTSFSVDKEGWRFTPTSTDTYQVTRIPFELEPITPGDKISYVWYAGDEIISESKEVVVTPFETTRYKAVCTLCAGIRFETEVTVVVVPYIPNAFTPNGDGLNDEFKILGLPPEDITLFNIQIFDRWGKAVFTSSDIRKGWNGMLNGEYCETGLYTWVIFYETGNRTKNSNKGSVLLIR